VYSLCPEEVPAGNFGQACRTFAKRPGWGRDDAARQFDRLLACPTSAEACAVLLPLRYGNDSP
jgi:hypothetical protein